MRLRLVLAAAVYLATTVWMQATALPPADQPVEAAIDQQIEAAIAAAGVAPAPQADDATLIRRLTLDLVGRIPTTAEADAYVTATDPDKRAKLVDRLMASPAFVRFQAVQIDVMLNSTVAGGDRRRGGVGRRRRRCC